MKVEELSIGDWVCAVCGEKLTPPMQIVGLGDSWVWLKIDPNQGDPFEFEPDEIRGIEITPEMLEQNGWTKVRYSIKIYAIESEDCSLVYYIEGNVADFRRKSDRCSVTCRYVHELQHALRLVCVEKEVKL